MLSPINQFAHPVSRGVVAANQDIVASCSGDSATHLVGVLPDDLCVVTDISPVLRRTDFRKRAIYEELLFFTP